MHSILAGKEYAQDLLWQYDWFTIGGSGPQPFLEGIRRALRTQDGYVVDAVKLKPVDAEVNGS